MIGALVNVHGAFFGNEPAHFFPQIGRLHVSEAKHLYQALPAIRDSFLRAVQQFRIQFGLLAFGDEHNGVARFDRSNSLQSQRAIHQVNPLPVSQFFRAHNRQLALDLGMLHHALAGGLRQPLHDHVNIRALEADLNFIRGTGFVRFEGGGLIGGTDAFIRTGC